MNIYWLPNNYLITLRFLKMEFLVCLYRIRVNIVKISIDNIPKGYYLLKFLLYLHHDSRRFQKYTLQNAGHKFCFHWLRQSCDEGKAVGARRRNHKVEKGIVCGKPSDKPYGIIAVSPRKSHIWSILCFDADSTAILRTDSRDSLFYTIYDYRSCPRLWEYCRDI